MPQRSEPESLLLVIGDGGWVRVALRDIKAGPTARLDEAHIGASVLARAARDGSGRVGVAELRLYREDGSALSAEPLRALPFPQLERLLNMPAVADAVSASIERGHDVPPESAVRIPTPDKEKAPAKREQRAAGMWEYARDTTVAVLVPLQQRPRDLKLPVRMFDGKDTRKRPDEFYQQVADVFSRAPGARPAASIAEANKVPVSTVHRWVKEARRRGLMPPGRIRSEIGEQGT